MTEHISLTGDDGQEIQGRIWATEEPRLVVLIAHGMGEHIDRYDGLAARLNGAGIAVIGHNHRGHGIAAGHRGHFADRLGWHSAVDDIGKVYEHARAVWPDTPIVLLGHSMGSFLAQDYASRYGGGLAGLILSGSTWPNRLSLAPGWLIARIVALFKGRRGYSDALDAMGFSAMNRRFKPARTDSDWLSRDEKQVDLYRNDALTGPPFTAGFWVDVIGGMWGVSSDALLIRIPGDLPIMILGGSDDPVGGDKGLGKLVTHYAQTGHQRLKIKIYKGGRHEMLNETNRDEVMDDIAAWLEPLATSN